MHYGLHFTDKKTEGKGGELTQVTPGVRTEMLEKSRPAGFYTPGPWDPELARRPQGRHQDLWLESC